jgi:hypothetical protein
MEVNIDWGAGMWAPIRSGDALAQGSPLDRAWRRLAYLKPWVKTRWGLDRQNSGATRIDDPIKLRESVRAVRDDA